MKIIYCDNNSTTQVDKKVLNEMLPYFCEKFGNASSIDHVYGNELLPEIKKARESIAKVINCDFDEIIFTSGATESNNLAIMGTVEQLKEKGNHIITSSIEHKSILNVCQELEKRGFQVTYVSPDKSGVLKSEDIKSAITDQTILISIMGANNEIGTIQPIKEIGIIAKEKGIVFHTDSAQAFGKISLDVNNIDLMSISSHKVYGPKGIGALFIRRGVKIKPIIFGGGQEGKIRPGTYNVPSIVGFGKASELVSLKNQELIKNLTMNLYDRLSEHVQLNGDLNNRIPGNLNLFVEDVDSKALINEVKTSLAISAGSACNSDEVTPSHVILALGYDDNRAYSSIRIGLGRFTTEEEINKVVNVLIPAIKKLRNL